VEAGWGPPIRSIIDVPFETGTFALNSRRAHAFGPEDQELFGQMAVVLQQGFLRILDLQEMQDRSLEAERLAAERQESLARELVLGKIRDQVLSMRNLRDGLQHADMLAALQQLGVPVDGLSLQFSARAPDRYESFYASTDFSFPGANEGEPLDRHPWVREAWETGAPVVVSAARLESTEFADWGLWEILEVPLPGGGSLGVNRRDGGHFTSDMVRTVEAFANVVAGGAASTGFWTSGGERGAAQASGGEPASGCGAFNRGRTDAVPECGSTEDLWLHR
jgi:hypothetical protein